MELRDFRPHEHVTLRLSGNLTVIHGPNGSGKTSLLEAAGYLASLSSFRTATTGDLVRAGASCAIVRGEFSTANRTLLVETEIRPAPAKSRARLNRQVVRRAADLAEQLPVLTFQPDDLLVVKGPPSQRRAAIDGAVLSLHPAADAERRRLESCLRQRNALLRQIGHAPGGSLAADDRRSLDIWDDRLGEAAENWARRRRAVVRELEPRLERLFGLLAGVETPVRLSYEPTWLTSGLRAALSESRKEDLLRATTTVGPHRDDLLWELDYLPARTHASQGNQRALSLSLRLALGEAMTESTGEAPLLLLDDVFSELDPQRQQRLLELLPAGQILLATAGAVPPAERPAQMLHMEELAVTGATAP